MTAFFRTPLGDRIELVQNICTLVLPHTQVYKQTHTHTNAHMPQTVSHKAAVLFFYYAVDKDTIK